MNFVKRTIQGIVQTSAHLAATYHDWSARLRAKRVKDRQLEELQTVGILLGPYRNLSTLTASVLYLHPDCEVLNHAGTRIFGRKDLNFAKEYSPETLRNFCRYAIAASRGGARGHVGGDIGLAHAFQRERMRSTFEARFGCEKELREPKALVWKESMKVTKELRAAPENLEMILEEAKCVRFIIPIRNPLDCAFSNQKTEHYEHLSDSFADRPEDPSVEEILEVIFEVFAWGISLQEKYPSKVTCLFQHEMSLSRLGELEEFLGLSVDERWKRDSLPVWNVPNQKYDYTDVQRRKYGEFVNEHFGGKPKIQEKFLEFLDELSTRAS